MDDYAKKLGRTLAALRQNLGITQEQMATKARIAPSTYARHELGRDAPTGRLLERYIRELGLLPWEFYRVHEFLLKARGREAIGAAWWMAFENVLCEDQLEDEEVRDKLRQFGALQSDILEVILGRFQR